MAKDAQAWPALDLLTIDSGANPLLGSYVGIPTKVRGVDDANYAQALMAWWAASGDEDRPGLGFPLPGAIAPGSLPSASSGGGWWDKIKTGTAGILLALLVVGAGLYLLVAEAK